MKDKIINKQYICQIRQKLQFGDENEYLKKIQFRKFM